MVLPSVWREKTRFFKLGLFPPPIYEGEAEKMLETTTYWKLTWTPQNWWFVDVFPFPGLFLSFKKEAGVRFLQPRSCVCFFQPKKSFPFASPNTPPAVDIETKKWSMSTCFLSKQRRPWPRYRECCGVSNMEYTLRCPPWFRLGSPTKNIINTHKSWWWLLLGRGTTLYIPNIQCHEHFLESY